MYQRVIIIIILLYIGAPMTATIITLHAARHDARGRPDMRPGPVTNEYLIGAAAAAQQAMKRKR